MIFLKMFIAFFKIGAFTFGGGYAMIPLIQAEVVDKNGWLTDEEFIDTIAIAQSAPGAIAVNSSVFVGYKIKKTVGALTCMFAVILPPFFVILFIATFFDKFKNNEIMEKVFLGIRPAVVGLIASAVYKIGKSMNLNKEALIIPALTLGLVVILGVSPVVIILSSGIGGVVVFKVKELINKGPNNI